MNEMLEREMENKGKKYVSFFCCFCCYIVHGGERNSKSQAKIVHVNRWAETER